MANYSNDPVLRDLAKGLQDIQWRTELTVAERDMVINSPGRNLTVMPDGKTYAIRMYLNGSVRTLGITRHPETAFRFADLCLGRFWKYRQRNVHPPGPGEINFTSTRLAEDKLYEAEANELLDRIEQHLSLPERSQTPPRKSRSRVAELSIRCDNLQQQVTTLENRINEILHAFRTIRGHLEKQKSTGASAASAIVGVEGSC